MREAGHNYSLGYSVFNFIPIIILNALEYSGAGCNVERYCESFWSTCLTVRSLLIWCNTTILLDVQA